MIEEEMFDKIWQGIVTRAWADPTFKKRLLSHPEEVLRENGINIPKGMSYKIHENAENHINLVFPYRPGAGEKLSSDRLKKLAAAGNIYPCNIL